MKKDLLKSIALLVSFLSGATLASAQSTHTSIANGNFLNPLTWDCVCIPLPWDNIIVNSDVVLDTNWYSTVSFTVTPGSSLIENAVRNFAVNSGSFTNNGTVDISRFAVLGGSVINNDSMRVNNALYIAGSFENHYKLVDVDSLYNDEILKNLSGATITGDLYSNLDSVVNEGTIAVYGHTNTTTGRSYNSGTLDFTDYTNAGIAYNSGTLLFNDFTNASSASFYNSAVITGTQDFWNAGDFSNLVSGNFTVARDFANGDSSTAWALFLNNGFVKVDDDWINIDSVSGGPTGRFCIADSTYNYGIMAGTFDFCDNTPPSSQPFIDLNSGTITPAITWCAQSCVVSVVEQTADKKGFILAPNPASDGKFIVESLYEPIATLDVYDFLGRKIFSADKGRNSSRIPVNLSGKGKGIFLVRMNGNVVGKILIR